MDSQTFEQEKNKLKLVVFSISQAKNALESSLTVLGVETLDRLKELRDAPESGGMDFLLYLEQISNTHETFNIKDKYKQLDELSYLEKQPYFARIDLVNEEDNNKLDEIYIGKFGYTKDKPVVTDWRAKIASVYYRYRFPQKNVRYITPAGEEIRDLTLKRTFEIDNAVLLKYFNNDIQLDENEIIVEKIDKRTGGVLEDIIETIHESQLDIIESDPRKVTIVQGCVGSGKSTVAIHKLSHIFFNFPELIQPERSILIAKNQILVSYLSTLFPKLGIFNINYKTLRELMVNVVFREKISIKMDLDEGEHLTKMDVAELRKMEEVVKRLIQKYIDLINEELDKDEFKSFGGFVFLDSLALSENIKELLSDLKEELDFQKERLKENPESVYAFKYTNNIRSLVRLTKKINKLLKDLTDVDFVLLLSELGVNKNSTKLNYKESLMYLWAYSYVFGINSSYKYRYCVVDEGQDFSLLEYSFIDKVVQKGRFCILGDLNQGYLDEGLSNWDDIKYSISNAKGAKVFELDTNYRSTKPIIDLANQILSPYTDKHLPKSINRKGSLPTIEVYSSNEEIVSSLITSITEDLKHLDKSIGVIVYNDGDFDAVAQELNTLQIPDGEMILLDSKKRITYIPRGVYLSRFTDCKGLEFSKVYVLGLDLTQVSNFSDAKKAFVAVTRAMNELVVYGVKDSK